MATTLSQCTCAYPAIRIGYATSSLKPSLIARHVTAHALPVGRTRKKSAPTRDAAPVSDDGNHYLRSEAIQVTKDISACQTWEQIAQLYEQHNGKLWHINIAALFSRLAYLMNAKSYSQLDGPDLEQFTVLYNSLWYTASKAMRQGMQPAEMAIIAGSVGRMGIPQQWLLETLMEVSEPFLASRVCSLQHATQMAYGLAQAQQRPTDSWLSALLHCTMLTMSQAAMHAAWVSEQKHSRKSGRHSASTRKGRANKQGASEQSGIPRENLSRQPQSSNQGGYKKHASTTADSTADDMNSKRCTSDARSLANLLHALACQMRVMPHADWLHVWVLATEQLLPYANAIEVVQMLEGLAQVSCFHKTLHSSPSSKACNPSNSLGDDSGSNTPFEFPQQVASQQSSLSEPVAMPPLSVEWQRLLCNRLDKLIRNISPTMAKVALRALEHLAAEHYFSASNLRAVLDMLRQACSKGQARVVSGSPGASLSISNATIAGQ